MEEMQFMDWFKLLVAMAASSERQESDRESFFSKYPSEKKPTSLHLSCPVRKQLRESELVECPCRQLDLPQLPAKHQQRVSRRKA